MNKYNSILDSNEIIVENDDILLDDNLMYMTNEEFKLNQNDEHYDFYSDLYEFVKDYMDSKNDVFPIMNFFNFHNFGNFLKRYMNPLNYE